MTDWSKAEKYYDLGNTAGFALSLLEAESTLRKVLHEKKLAGKTTEEKLALARPSLSQYQALGAARKLVQEILSLSLPNIITKQAAEQILRVYFTTITELEQMPRWEINKINLRTKLNTVQKTIIKYIVYIAAALIAILGIALFLADTGVGMEMTYTLVSWSHFFFYRALPATIIFILLITILAALLIRATHKKHPEHHG